ncbi:xylulokinase [Streptacidiphilus sp. ASG 303]|uniref:xylulokinase n=1 Tax=Streptacidiphilus sp. ASG 303 TaxID=2896847 RepID=UPI001E6414C4|nr:xylulokinase [Streptacidiphilus sp. ASG 303]MCD0483584.1 xylulokinase [Streptacidiphilus sp. ASG 303]
MARIVIGVDSSTQAAKALAVDADTGRVLGGGRAPHTVTGTGGARESDPLQWWQALQDAVAATGHAGRAEAVAVGGQQHGLVTLDADGRPVHPALLWNDTRSAGQAAALVEELGPAAWARRTGSVPNASFTVSKWAWLRDRRLTGRVAAVRLPHEYLTERLTGRPVAERSDASGTGWWDGHGWDEGILGLVGLDPALLPPLQEPGTPAGETRGAFGGLRPGTPVALGAGDNAAAALGLGLGGGPGAVHGRPVLSLGTSGTVYAATRGRPADPSGTVAGFADAHGDWLPLACTLNCTLAVDRVAALLGRDREAVEPGGRAVVLPFLDGERTPALPHAAGLVHGLRHDTTAGQLLQAAYDGAAHTLLAALDRVLGAGGESAGDAPLLLIGGGARGHAWQDTVRRLSGRAVQVPVASELVALGAAAQAAGLLTGEHPAAVARRWGTAAGPVLEPVERDTAATERIAAVLAAGAPLLGGG